jgi:hypothetical protein
MGKSEDELKIWKKVLFGLALRMCAYVLVQSIDPIAMPRREWPSKFKVPTSRRSSNAWNDLYLAKYVHPLRKFRHEIGSLRGGSDCILVDKSACRHSIDNSSAKNSTRISLDHHVQQENSPVSKYPSYINTHIRFRIQDQSINKTDSFPGKLIQGKLIPPDISGSILVNSSNFIATSVQNFTRMRRRKRDPADLTQREWTSLCNPVMDEWIALMNQTETHAHSPSPLTTRKRLRNTILASSGNYSSYYWRRATGGVLRSITPGVWNDARLELLRAEWFLGQHCLDIGCNSGLFTMSVAYKFRFVTTFPEKFIVFAFIR